MSDFITRIKIYFLLLLAKRHHKENIQCKSKEPKTYTHRTNIDKMDTIPAKVKRILPEALRLRWDARLAYAYAVEVQGLSIVDLTDDLKRLTSLLNANFRVDRELVNLCKPETSLNLYLTQHQSRHINPSTEVRLFCSTCLEYHKALSHYLVINPDNATYALRLMSSYVDSIRQISDDLIDLQCDLLSV